MVSRRTRARISFVTNAFSLSLAILALRRFSNGGRTSASARPEWLVVGGTYQVLYCMAYDRDLGGIRRSRWRRVLLRVLLQLGLQTAEWSVRRNVTLGQSAGNIGYRLWYGVLRPLPGTDE